MFVGGLLWSTTHSLFRAKLRSKRVSIHHLAGFQVADVSLLLAGTSLHLLAPKVRQKLLSLRKTTVEVRKLSTGLLWSCSIETITPSILVGRQVFLALPEGLQPSFDYVYINTYQTITSKGFSNEIRKIEIELEEKLVKTLKMNKTM